MMVVAELVPVDQARVVLEEVRVKATLRGLCSETHMRQSYRNLEERNIEAVYTFPLPLDAVLLELRMELNGKVLQGVILAKNEAETAYEQAVEAGDTAVLLRKVEPGIYSLSVGNLLPGERAIIHYRYSQLHHWQGDGLRFQLPTTIAPRYGDPLSCGLAPYEIPEYVLNVDRGFSLELCIEGALAEADFECPTHPIRARRRNQSLILDLAGGSALMDRDFVLMVYEGEQVKAQGYWAQDGEEYTALACFHPRYPGTLKAQSRVIKLVVDCSGSMAGDAIAQAKIAVSDILTSLNAEDQFNITIFGSHCRLLFTAPAQADRRHLQMAQRFVETMDANMGGTEIGLALQATYKASVEGEACGDILLITDGDIWDSGNILREAKRSGHRIFSIGVGSAVSEGFVREIAQVTGGASELVSPREQMAVHIVRHFQRIHQPRAVVVDVYWPSEIRHQSPEIIENVYAGDTLHLFARLDCPPSSPGVMTVQYEAGTQVEQSMDVLPTQEQGTFEATLPRLAAHARLSGLERQTAQALALRYQLVSEYTYCVLVYPREDDEKAEDLPVLRQVPQMLAAGWGGLGEVGDAEYAEYIETPVFLRKAGLAGEAPFLVEAAVPPATCAIPCAAAPEILEDLDMSASQSKVPESGPQRLQARLQEKRGPIDVLDTLPFGLLQTLRRQGIATLADLIALTREELFALEEIDEDDVALIIAALKAKGWRLRKQGMLNRIFAS